MNKKEIIQNIENNGAVAVIRIKDPDKLMSVANAISEGGVKIIEITMTVPNAIDVIKAVTKVVSNDILIGVGSVMNNEIAQQAIDAGAKFVVSPITKKEIIDITHKNNLPVFPGAFSPTEIQQAFEWGADIVKVFPADTVGMKYFKSIKAPMPHLKLMPTGGVTLTNAGEWMANGACAVGIGSALLDEDAISKGDYNSLTERAKILMKSINNYRSSIVDKEITNGK